MLTSSGDQSFSEVPNAAPEWQAKILFGESSTTDEFEGQGHDRSAKALADGIRQISERIDGRQRAGGAIGLEGAWGSGKSTVIEIARRQHLGADYVVFSFDLWRHQSDDFRRAILEQFIVFVRESFNPRGRDGKHIYNSTDLRPQVELNIDEKHDQIRNRKSVTTKSSRRRVTLFGAILALLLPLLPLAYAVGSPVLRGAEWPSFEYGGITLNPLAFWSVLLMLGYLGASAAILALANNSPSFEDKKQFNGRTAWLRGGASHLLNLSERDQNNEVTQTIRDENPTTVEFRSVFEDILKPLQKSGRRVVFVLDNIDRLPISELSKVWAELRALIAGNGVDPHSAVVAVIPYDRDHVGAAFPPLKLPKLVIEDNGARRIDRNNGIDFETDVFEKTFDRVVKVSAPLPSSWKRFLLNRIEDAAFVGNHSADYTEKLFRLLRYQLELEGIYATPRRIISFVNEIGGLWVQWAGSSIPIETVGLYVLHRHHFDRDPNLLSKPMPVQERFGRIVDDPDFPKHLAALAFNVAPDLADQVRLGIPITNALLQTNGHEVLDQLSRGVGFDEIFQEVLRERLLEWAVDSPEQIARAAENLAKVQLSSETEHVVWRMFADVLPTIETLSFQHANLPGLFTIVSRQTQLRPEIAANAIRAKIEKQPLAEGDRELTRKGSQWYQLLRRLASSITAAAGEERGAAYWRTTTPSALEDFNVGVILAHHEGSERSFNDIALGIPMATLSTAIAKMAAQDTSGYAACIKVLGRRLREHSGEQLDAIAAQLGTNEPSEAQTYLIRAAVDILAFTSGSEFVTAFDTIREDAIPKHARFQVDNSDDLDIAKGLVLAVAVLDGEQISLNRSSSEAALWLNGLLSDCKEIPTSTITELASVIDNAYEGEFWLEYAVKSSNPGGLYHVVAKALAARSTINGIPLVFMVKSFDRLQAIVGTVGVDFFLANCRASEDEVSKVVMNKGAIIPSSMVASAKRLGDRRLPRIILQNVADYLLSIDAAGWHSAFGAKADDRRRLLVAIQSAEGIELGSEFIQGLVAISIDVLESKINPSAVHDDWNEVFAAIPLSQFTALRKQIASKMLKGDITPSGSTAFVSVFSKIAHKMKFSDNAETADNALTHFLWHLASSDNEVAQGYLDDAKNDLQDTLKAASSDDVREAFHGVRKRSDKK